MAEYSTDPFENKDIVYDEPEIDVARALGIVAAVVVFLLVVGIGVWFFVRNKTKDVKVVPPTTTIENGGVVSAKDGGEVTYKDANGRTVRVIIPAGALKEDTKITIVKTATGSVTDTYLLKPEGIVFLKPVTVVIPYKESGLKNNETPTDIELEYWFANKYTDKTLLKYSVDEKAYTLSTKVNKF